MPMPMPMTMPPLEPPPTPRATTRVCPSLREELQSQQASKSELVATLYTMGGAAEGQLEHAREAAADNGDRPGDAGLLREAADLELFCEMAHKQVGAPACISYIVSPQISPNLPTSPHISILANL